MLCFNYRITVQSTIASYRIQPRLARLFNTSKPIRRLEDKQTHQQDLVKSTHQSNVGVPLGTKGIQFNSYIRYSNLDFTIFPKCLVKDAGKTVWYTGIVICGFIATGAILFAVIKELFWSQSPQSIYSDALKKCTEFPRICDLLGEPITGFCDGSGRRGRTNLRFTLVG